MVRLSLYFGVSDVKSVWEDFYYVIHNLMILWLKLEAIIS